MYVRIREWCGAAVDDVRGAGVALSRIGEGSDDAERIDLIRALEELKCSAEAAQAVLTAAFDRSQREAEAARVCPRSGRAGRSPPRSRWRGGSRPIGVASTSVWRWCCVDEMPATRAAFRAGRITEWRAMLLARETACLSRADRAEVDRRVAGDPDVLEAMGDGEIVGRAREAGLRARPGLVRRAAAPGRGRPSSLTAAGARRDEPALDTAAGEGRRRGVGRAHPRGRPAPGGRRRALARPDHGRHARAPRPQPRARATGPCR